MGKLGKTTTRMIIMLIGVGLLFGTVFFFKMLERIGEKKFTQANKIRIFTVSAMPASESDWQPQLTATGSLRTVKGVNVTTELAGMVRKIVFTPGAMVNEGTLLVQLDIDPDVAKLHALQAQAAFAKITYRRNQRQYKIGAVSAEQLASDEASYKNTAAQVSEQQAIIAEKTVRAPFSGKLGISLVNPGQYIRPGDNIVVLQTLNPIYVDFNLPQEVLAQLHVGQIIQVTVDSFSAKNFTGKITTINPEVDSTTRNILVEGTLSNAENILLPGMFVNVMVTTGSPEKFLTLPQAAITYNPYGEMVYLLKKTQQQKNGQPVWQANQIFVVTGETRGNQVAVLKGVNSGDLVVTSGQLKLQNGSLVIINNSVQPSDDPNPQVMGE